MSLKTQLCRAVRVHKDLSGATYTDISSATLVHVNQISAILNSDGKGVSIENIEKVLSYFNVSFYLVVEDEIEDEENW